MPDNRQENSALKKPSPLRRLYDWTLDLAGRKYASAALFVVSFTESSFFPIPPDILLAPMVLARPKRALFYAFICTLASVLGAILGYFIGALFYDAIAAPIIEFYGYGDKWDAVAGQYNKWGIWFVLVAGLTPIPFKVFTIASGATGLAFPVFLAGSIISRGVRYFIIATLIYFFGPRIQPFIERHLGTVFAICLALLIGGFVAIKYLF